MPHSFGDEEPETKEAPCPRELDPSSGRPPFSNLGLTFPKVEMQPVCPPISQDVERMHEAMGGSPLCMLRHLRAVEIVQCSRWAEAGGKGEVSGPGSLLLASKQFLPS